MPSRIALSSSLILMLLVFPFLLVQAQDGTASTIEPVITELAAETYGEESNSDQSTTAEGAAPDETETTVLDTGADALSDTASSTEEVATSTPPVEEPKPVEEPFVLQPAVEYAITGNSIDATITLENLTCRRCEKVLPDLDVIAYYTPWYPNDGESHVGKVQTAAKNEKVPSIANWEKGTMTYSASDIAPGRYYFVVEVDPSNEHGAYYLFRSEFSI